MWNLYCQAKATNRPPSDILNIRQIDIELSGMESEWSGWWTAYQIDNAVTYFGAYIENKLAEMDDKGKPINKLEDFVEDDPDKLIRRSLEEARAAFASVSRTARKR